jgi:phosphoenolpyruvate-protein kinase (PTS system EI component)
VDHKVLKHPLIAQTVAAIVTEGGGCVEYDTGGGGREVLIAASAQLAAATNSQLTIVEYRHLHSQIRAMVGELQAEVSSAVLSADEAALQPAGSVDGVLAVHADVLRDPRVRQPLLAMARSADHLVVARHSYSDATLDDLAGPVHTLGIRDLMPPPAPRPNPGPRLDTLPVGLRDLVAARWAESQESKQRFMPEAAAPRQDGEESAEMLQDIDPEELERRVGDIRDQQRQRIESHPAPDRQRPVPHGHSQEQAAAHQQQGPHCAGRA